MKTKNTVTFKSKMCVKATLFHLNREQSEIITLLPKSNLYSEPYELIAMYLKETICVLTRQWLQIEKFEIRIGKIENGSFKEIIKYKPYEIPINMIYIKGERGKWLPYNELLT